MGEVRVDVEGEAIKSRRGNTGQNDQSKNLLIFSNVNFVHLGGDKSRGFGLEDVSRAMRGYGGH